MKSALKRAGNFSHRIYFLTSEPLLTLRVPRLSRGNGETILDGGPIKTKILRMRGGSRATCRALNKSWPPNSGVPRRRLGRPPTHQIDHTALNPNRGPTEATRIASREPQRAVIVKAIAAILAHARLRISTAGPSVNPRPGQLISCKQQI